MTLDVHQLALLGLLTTSVHWLVGRSTIARPLWSRARGWLSELLRCPACSGWWIGLGLGAAGLRPVGGLPHRWEWHSVGPVVVTGLLAIVVTPVVEAIMLFGLQHSAIPDEPPFPGEDDTQRTDVERRARDTLGLPNP